MRALRSLVPPLEEGIDRLRSRIEKPQEIEESEPATAG
jgi:hypothetical protein